MTEKPAIFQFQEVSALKLETNFELRKWNTTWWMNQRSIMKILARHDSAYEDETGLKYFIVDAGEKPDGAAEAKRSKISEENSK